MSGHKVVSLLEERGDVFIHGGPLRRRKGTAVARERLQQQGDPSAASSSSNNTNNNLVEFVVGTKCTYKIRSRGGGGLGIASTTDEGGGGGEGVSGNKGDREVFDFDADAMMHAAQRGEDIPTAIRKAEAAARAANRKRQAALIKMRESNNNNNKDGSNSPNKSTTVVDDQQQLQQEEEEVLATVDALVTSPQGEADLTALKIRQGKNMLDVMWAQEHCFVKCITPLTSVEAEHELQKEREEEEKREREELFHLMHDDDEFTSIKQPKRDPSKIQGGGGAVDKYATTITGGVPANISANDTRINEGLVNGFVIHFFNPMKPHPKPYEHLTETGKAFANTLACGRHAATPASPTEFYTVSHPALRTRMYLSQTQYEQEEWCLVYRTALLNYWHERLEASVISAPEIFQFQVFGVDIGGNVSSAGNGHTGGLGGGGGGGKPIRSIGCPVHVVLSTSALYLIPRGTKEEFERDDVMKTKRMPLEALNMVSVDKAAGTVWISGGPLRGNNNNNKSTSTSVEGVPVGFYSPGEAYDFVLELQRVWELAGCASGDAKFPYTIVTPSA